MKRLWILGILVLALALLAGCGPQPETLPAEEAEAFAEQVAPLTENLLTGLSNGDEAAYTRDMVEKMRAVSTGEQFTQTREAIIGKIGAYVSSEMTGVTKQANFQTVVYDAQFENEERVIVRVVYDLSGSAPKVAGLWLDSPKLRGQ